MEKSSAGTAYTLNYREEGRNTNTSSNTYQPRRKEYNHDVPIADPSRRVSYQQEVGGGGVQENFVAVLQL
jgi:hypothetical protein